MDELGVEFGEVTAVLDGVEGVEALKIEGFAFTDNCARIELDKALDLSFKLAPALFRGKVAVSEGARNVAQLLLRGLHARVKGFVVEEAIPRLGAE